MFVIQMFLTGYFKYLTIKGGNTYENTIYQYKYIAPKKNFILPSAKPYPAVQRGGIRAVAIATPGGFPFSTLVIAIAPTKPQKKR
jgi:hypothetical protein